MSAPPKAARKPPRTWLLYGEDPRFFLEPAKKWTEAWADGEEAETRSASIFAAAEFHTAVRSLPLMRPSQAIRVTHLESGSRDLLEMVAEYVRKPVDSTALLLEYVGLPPGAGRGARKGRKGDPMKAVVEALPALHCKPPSLRSYVRSRAEREGFRVDGPAVEALEEWSCGDPGRVAAAMDQLILFRLNEKTIREEDVIALLGAGGFPRRWDLQDAFLRRDREAFLGLVAATSRDPEVEKDRSGTAIAFLGMLAKQVRSLLTYFGLEARGLPARDITPQKLALSPFPAKKLKGFAKRWREQEARRALEVFFRLDLALKGARGSQDPWTLMERHLSIFLTKGTRRG